MLRTHALTIRLNDEEYEAVRTEAFQRGVQPAVYARAQVLRDEAPAKKRSTSAASAPVAPTSDGQTVGSSEDVAEEFLEDLYGDDPLHGLKATARTAIEGLAANEGLSISEARTKLEKAGAL